MNNLNLNEAKIMLMHSKPVSQSGKKGVRVTVAAHYDTENAVFKIGVSRCSKQDVFTKKTGREIAIGRLGFLGSKPTTSFTVEPEADLRRLFRNKFYQIENLLQTRGIKKLERDLDNTPGAELKYEPLVEEKSESVIEIS